MFERINKKVKGFFSSQRMKTLALMLLVGTTAAMAQNAAGDYSAGTTALTTVTEEIAKYVPIVVKLCYAIMIKPPFLLMSITTARNRG